MFIYISFLLVLKLKAKEHILKITAAGSSDTLFWTTLTMESLFSPCTRSYDILESQGHLERVGSHDLERELNLNVSTEELLSADRAFTYSDLYAMLGNQRPVVWLTPHAAVTRNVMFGIIAWEHQLGRSCRFSFSADGKQIVAVARSPEHLLEICDVVLRLLALSVLHSVHLHNCISPGLIINAPALMYLMEQCQSLKFLLLENLEIDENHCRVLGAYSRPDLVIVLDLCTISNAGASALAEVLGRNQGPTRLEWCHNDNLVLAVGLRGNSRLKSLNPRISRSPEDGNRDLLAIAGALRENKGLVRLDLTYNLMTAETWGAIRDSLKTHPTLEILSLHTADLAEAELKSRIQVLEDMLKVNISIQTILLSSRYNQDEIFRELLIPYLETNRLRGRVRAIQRTRPIAYRAKIVGRALLAVRTDPNRFWMPLSGNAEVAFPSTTATTAPATNLPTPIIVAASANAAGVAATTATLTSTATVTDTRIASTAGASATANVATPTACQKRKARP
jgi:hypothetical protein